MDRQEDGFYFGSVKYAEDEEIEAKPAPLPSLPENEIVDLIEKLYVMKKNVEISPGIIRNKILRFCAEHFDTDTMDNFSKLLKSLDKEAAELKQEKEVLEKLISTEVILYKRSFASEHLQAVYAKPRTTWDPKILEGYSLAHPEINIAKKTSESGSASFRGKKNE